jgi:hypothetical protein
MGKWTWVVAIAVAACGSGSSPPDATITIDSAVAIDASPPDAVGFCNTLALPSTLVPQNGVAEDPPPPMGGQLDPGLYVMTDWSVYTGVGGASGPAGPMGRAAISVDGLNYEYLNGVTSAAPTITDTSGTYQNSGTTTMSEQGCPNLASNSFEYSADPTTFVLYISANEVLTFTKQ